MYWFHTAERATLLPGMAKQAGRWLLPWAGVLVVSATLTLAAELAFAGSPLDRSVASGASAATAASRTQSATEPTNVMAAAGSHWLLLWSVNPETRVSCLTTRDRVSADMLHVHPEDLDRLEAELCN
jgi:hypothetical protein